MLDFGVSYQFQAGMFYVSLSANSAIDFFRRNSHFLIAVLSSNFRIVPIPILQVMLGKWKSIYALGYIIDISEGPLKWAFAMVTPKLWSSHFMKICFIPSLLDFRRAIKTWLSHQLLEEAFWFNMFWYIIWLSFWYYI